MKHPITEMPLNGLAPSGMALHAIPPGVDRFPVTDRAAWLRMRERDVTASVIGSLLGVHEFETAYSLYARKTGALVPDDDQTAAQERGTLLEPVAVELLRRRQPGWQVEYPVGWYYRDPRARIGATPDALAVDDEGRLVNCQIKSVEATTFRRKWIDPETREVSPPLWIAVQSMIEAHLTGASRAVVLPLVVGYGLDMPVVEVPIHAGVIDRCKTEVAAFWRAVEAGTPPDVDAARDGALLEQLWTGGADPVDLSGDNAIHDLVAERERLSTDKTGAEKRLKAIKTEILLKLGQASAGRLADGRVITIKSVERAGYTVEPSSYVDLRIGKARKEAA